MKVWSSFLLARWGRQNGGGCGGGVAAASCIVDLVETR
jgi:hypothetical protein